MKYLSAPIGLLAAALLAAQTQARLNVVATTPDLGAIAREIGGDRVEVTTLARPTEDPHYVDAKPSYVVKLNRADALIDGGAELESGWLPPLLEGARNSKIALGQPGRIPCNRGIKMLEVPATLDRSQGDIHAAGNPHYTTNPDNGGMVAETIAGAFAKLDPAAAGHFQANLVAFKERLAAKEAEWVTLLAPFKGREVVTYHNYWPYLAGKYGLKMDLFLEPKPGIPPSPSHLAEVVRRMKTDGINVILVQPYVSRRTADTAARLAGAKVLDVPAYPGGKGSEGYIEWMDALVRALADGFQNKN